MGNAFGLKGKSGALEDDDVDYIDPEEDIEEFDIELNSRAPTFLEGKIERAQQLSPTRLIKNPEGSLQRTASNGSALARERREMRDDQKKVLSGGKSARNEKINAPYSDDPQNTKVCDHFLPRK